MNDGYVSSGELCRQTGITYRRVHYWWMRGAICPTVGGYDPGSGHKARWSPRDVARLQAIGRFADSLDTVARGVLVDTIATIWKGLEHADVIELGQGYITITVRIKPDPQAVAA